MLFGQLKSQWRSQSWNKGNLVGGLEHEFLLFHIYIYIYWECHHSSQLTNSYFSRWLKPPTSETKGMRFTTIPTWCVHLHERRDVRYVLWYRKDNHLWQHKKNRCHGTILRMSCIILFPICSLSTSCIFWVYCLVYICRYTVYLKVYACMLIFVPMCVLLGAGWSQHA